VAALCCQIGLVDLAIDRRRQLLGKAVFAWAMMCLVSLNAWPQTAPPNAQSITAALRGKQYKRALELAKQALNAAPGDVQILTLEALAWKGLGQNQNALTAFHQALRIAPNYLAALEGAAQIEYASGSDAAIPILDRLLRLRPDEPTAHAMRAVMAWKHRDCPTAIAHFELSRSVMASQPDALREYGTCLVRLNKPDAAATVFQQIVSTNPEDRPARYSLSAVQVMAQRYKDALDTLRPLLAASTDAAALALASTAYEALGDTPQAVAALRQAIVIAPRNVAYYLDFANLSFAHKSYDAGIQMVNAGLKLSPESPQLHLARGILSVQTGQIDQADADFAAAERLDPRQPGTADARVLEYLQQNNTDEAIRVVREEMKSRPNDAFLYYLLAEVLNWQGPQAGTPEFQQALNAASKAVQLQPDLTLARNLLSRLYLDGGQTKLAIEQCRRVLRANPNDPVALYRLMRALKISGDPEDAKQIPDLLRRFDEARKLASQQEALENRYKLVEAGVSSTAK
jgi:tetratricopeptide (TPR) repeat protein